MQSIIALFGLVAAAAAQTTANPVASAAAAISCQSAFTQCSSSGTPAATCNAQLVTCQTSCYAKQTTCFAAANSNRAACTAALYTCLGTSPAAAAGVGGPTTTRYLTAVVMSYTTYCPYATTFTNNGQAYTATGAGYVTVTNCPCTVTQGVTGAVGTPAVGTPATAVVVSSARANGTTATPARYTGGASNQIIGAGLSVVAAGAGLFALAL